MPQQSLLEAPPASRLAGPIPEFKCPWTTDGLDAAWVRVSGELDLVTVPELERVLGLPRTQMRLVVLDLRALTFMDTSGRHAIVHAAVRARERGHRLVLLRGPPHVDRVFTLTGDTDDLEVIDLSRSEPAVQALLQMAQDSDAALIRASVRWGSGRLVSFTTGSTPRRTA